ncbi:hypothetical protein, partial [Salmonella enterica]|uniref:hypothetical protein n=1 Tax=Salmonella enterica TaxID=28901 RepID=UPI001C9E8848
LADDSTACLQCVTDGPSVFWGSYRAPYRDFTVIFSNAQVLLFLDFIKIETITLKGGTNTTN